MPRTRTKSYPGSLTKRGGTWRLRLCVGARYFSYTVAGTRVEAENVAKERYKELAGDRVREAEGLPGPMRFSALLEAFDAEYVAALTPGAQRSYRNSFAPFRAFFVDVLGDPYVRTLRRSHVKRFCVWRRTARLGGEGGLSLHTVRRDKRVLHVLFNHALDMDYLDANPAHRVKVAKPDPRDPVLLDEAQLEALLTAAAAEGRGARGPMLHAYVLTLAETGLRADSEALALRWEDLDFGAGFVRVRNAPAAGRRTKGRRSRSVPMTDRLRTALQAHAAQFRLATYGGERSPYVFHHTVSGRGMVAGQRIQSIRDAFEAAMAEAKLPTGFRRHDLRHRRVTTWLAEGKSPVHVKEAMGHADLATTMGYCHFLPDHLQALVKERVEKVA